MNALAVIDSPAVSDEAGLTPRLLAFMAQASSFERADAVNALARAYLHCDLKPEARAQAEMAMTLALDDAEPRVRRALAEAVAGARNAPRALVLALAGDISGVACAVLAQSPLLRDADLVDCAAIGDAKAQTAIARRPRVSAPVSAALAEVGERAAVLALVGNLAATLAPPTLWRAFERFAQDPELRARLAERPALPAALRAALAAASSADAVADSPDPRRAERTARDEREQAFLAIAREAAAELPELVAWLRHEGHLTVALLLRALACGETCVFTQALAEMSGLPAPRVAGLVASPRGAGFAALYARAQMPAHLLPAFRIAAQAARDAVAAGGVDYRVARSMLRAMEALHDPALAPVEAMLWRLAGEAQRAQAREAVALALAAEQAIEVAPAPEPSAPPVLALNVEPGNENFAPRIELDTEHNAAPEPAVLAA